MRSHGFKILVIALTSLASGGAIAATVWKWVDKNGAVHYSDQPGPGAVRVDLNVQTYDAKESKIPSNRPITPQDSKTPVVPTYQKIEILKPVNEETFIGTGGLVSVSVQVDPGVQTGHSLRLELDGQRVSEPNSTATEFQLKEVPRGAHTLLASIVTRDGQVMIQSTAVTFFVQQQTITRPKK
jgi:Domain of unknown function (DUF4124)